MRTRHVFHAVDSHTEGMPTRVITGGIGTIPGATMAERRQYFAEHRDDVRTLLMYEPRGHAAMSGAMAIHPGWFDRSPCGTGTSARMAQLHARGELPLHQDFVNESFIGTEFTGRLVEETTVGGRPAVVPTVTGRAWVTGTAQYFLDPADPFPAGFLL
ncbi:proline racemase family protein [Streptomyces sirii]|uniref:proline racemase family protein n=1 Tax=Streptomyces sirii TaxID=3127701 RepID=UPI003D3605F1